MARAAHVLGADTKAGNMGGGAPRRSAPQEADSTSKAVRASWAPWAPAVTRASLRAAPPAGSAAGEHVVTAGRRQDPEGSVSRRCCSKGHATPPRASRKQAHCQLAALKETRTTYLHCSKTMRTAMPSFRALSNEQHALRCQAIVASTNNLGRIYGSKGTCRSALLILRRPCTRQVCNADENIRAA